MKKSWFFLVCIFALITIISVLSSCSKISKYATSGIAKPESASSHFPKYANLYLGIQTTAPKKGGNQIFSHEIKNTHLYNEESDTSVDFEIMHKLRALFT